MPLTPSTSSLSSPPKSQACDTFPRDDFAQPSKEHPLELKILLWNTWLLPSLLTDRRSHARALAISPHLNAYDIVVLNEAFSNKKALLLHTKHPYRYHPPRPTGRIMDSGLLFLSRYEIIGSGWERYEHVAGIDRFAGKGLGYITVKVEGCKERLQVFGTHMQAGASKSVQVARRAQALHVCDFVNRKRVDVDTEAIAIVTGDFNMGPKWDDEFKEFSVHYVDGEDARARCEAYEQLVQGTGLREIDCEQEHEKEYRGEICRFLMGGRKEQKSRASVRYEDLKGKDGMRLSDTKPMCLTLILDQ
ncbi:hypothetical protein MMC13_003213 [Lambiella insularis]|nr:hypothetical protein [Lambiella insularis]